MSASRHGGAGPLDRGRREASKGRPPRAAAARLRASCTAAWIDALERRCLLSAAVTEFQPPGSGFSLKGIALGGDGNLYFAEPGTGVAPGHIGEFDTKTQTFKQFSLPSPASQPQYVAAGPDGNVWFTESPGNAIGRLNPASGTVTEFPVPTANANPNHIIAASDGNLWFTESGATANKIAKITTSGAITEFSTLFAPPPADQPFGLVDRGDGNIWYVANGSSRVGDVSYNGSLAAETSIPTANSGPWGIATAPDANLYYTESNTDKIGRITSVFAPQSEISLPAGTQPHDIVRGPDGYLYFTESGRSRVAQLDPTTFAVAQEFITATPQSGPEGIVIGPDGNPWITEAGNGFSPGVEKIGRVNVHPDMENLTAGIPAQTAGQAFSGTVATFTSTIDASTPGDFAANINWGDGSLPTVGTITKGANGLFVVTGSHTYAHGPASPTLAVTVSRAAGDYPLTVSAPVTVNGTGNGGTPPVISIANVTQAEGNSGTAAFTFTVTRGGDLTGPSTVAYATADGTATVADGDYRPVSNTLAFNPGEFSKTITVLVNGDTKAEPDETFFVNLSSPTGATLGTSQGTGTILNDDGEGPFGGTAPALLGRHQAEDFDTGGEGVAYHDAEPANLGGQYRPAEGVDIESTGDAGGGYDVGWTHAGEYLKYTLQAATAGTYALTLRMANVGPGGTFHVDVDGAPVTGTLAVPDTGGFQNYADVNAGPITVGAGQHVVRIVFDTASSTGYSGNVNYFTFSPAGAVSQPFGGTPFTPGAVVEAENFDTGGEGVAYHDADPQNLGGAYRPSEGVDIQAAGDTGGGFDVGWTHTGEFLNYTGAFATAGNYDFSARVADAGAGGSFHVNVDGVNATGTIAIPDTGGFQNWTTVSKPGIPISAGTHVVQIVFDGQASSGFSGNLNNFKFQASGGGGEAPFNGTPATLPGVVQAENFDTGGDGVAYHDTDPPNLGGAYRPSEGVDIESLGGGNFAVDYTHAGEWLKYTVNVTAGGTYALDASVANVAGGGAFHVEVDGVNVTGTLAVANTGSWTTYADVIKAGITLTAGQHVVRFVWDANTASGFAGNLDAFKFS